MPFRWFRVNGNAYVAVHRTVQLKDVRLFGRLRLPKTSHMIVGWEACLPASRIGKQKLVGW